MSFVYVQVDTPTEEENGSAFSTVGKEIQRKPGPGPKGKTVIKGPSQTDRTKSRNKSDRHGPAAENRWKQHCRQGQEEADV